MEGFVLSRRSLACNDTSSRWVQSCLRKPEVQAEQVSRRHSLPRGHRRDGLRLAVTRRLLCCIPPYRCDSGRRIPSHLCQRR